MKLEKKQKEVKQKGFKEKRNTFESSEQSDRVGEMATSDAFYGSFLQLFFLNDSGNYATAEVRIFVFFVCALVLLIISCYTASVTNVFLESKVNLQILWWSE